MRQEYLQSGSFGWGGPIIRHNKSAFHHPNPDAIRHTFHLKLGALYLVALKDNLSAMGALQFCNQYVMLVSV
ncbi:hypothetical protein EDC26_107124 [Paralcaligenes ureilyticus]|uniref:Uncharacterized protein n=1 Tax=Paralcaligenes ureilyticus TaxID=627131 RepID=A0A4V2UYE5_9BURK|nr:hypothetical protein EDC26_107124 [Paralcaligenes ureilyticus]